VEKVEKILAQAVALTAAEQHELLNRLHDSIYHPQYRPAPAARPHVGV
jgi:hypothetical protein